MLILLHVLTAAANLLSQCLQVGVGVFAGELCESLATLFRRGV